MNTATITWTPCSESMPDSDSTVMIYHPDENEVIWIGYHDGETWRTAEGEQTKVTHWANFPEPPEA